MCFLLMALCARFQPQAPADQKDHPFETLYSLDIESTSDLSGRCMCILGVVSIDYVLGDAAITIAPVRYGEPYTVTEPIDRTPWGWIRSA